MTGYLVRRSGQMVVTLFLIVTVAFFLINAQPGDYASFYVLDPSVPPEARSNMTVAFGLDRPLWEQYGIHLKNTVTGEFGVSFGHYPRSVLEVIGERLPRTALLFLTSTVLSFYTGFLLGRVIAWRRGSVLDNVATLSGTALFTIFIPWFGLMMIWLFAFKLDWLPVGKFLDPLVWQDAQISSNQVFNNMIITVASFSVFAFVLFRGLRRFGRKWTGWPFALVIGASTVIIPVVWSVSGTGPLALDLLKHMVLPVATLTLVSFAGTMLLTRHSMLGTIGEDYILAARAKGLPDRLVRDRHAARNALLPVTTSLVYSLAFAIDGSVIVESIFSWPGMGQMLMEAVISEDLPLALGAFVFIGIFALIAHMVADVLYLYLDPRIRYQ